MPGDDSLLSARQASRKLGIGRDTFDRHVEAGVLRGVTDPVSGTVRYYLPSLRKQLAEATRVKS